MRKTKAIKGAANAFRVALNLNDKSRDIEDKILESPFYSYLYSSLVKKSPWPEAEKKILTNLACYMYARDVIKSRWEPAENFLSKDPMFSFFYAKDVIKGRFEQGEDCISTSSFWLCKYAELLGTLPENLRSAALLMSFEKNEDWIKEYIKNESND